MKYRLFSVLIALGISLNANAACEFYGYVMAARTYENGSSYIFASPDGTWGNTHYFHTLRPGAISSAAASAVTKRLVYVQGDAPYCGYIYLGNGGSLVSFDSY